MDTNLIAGLVLPSQNEDICYSVLAKDAHWIAPTLWASELRNVFSLYVRKKIITPSKMFRMNDEALKILKGNEYRSDSKAVLELVLESTCTAYDCEFVALAQSKRIPLVTFYKKILREFPDVAIHPQTFVLN